MADRGGSGIGGIILRRGRKNSANARLGSNQPLSAKKGYHARAVGLGNCLNPASKKKKKANQRCSDGKNRRAARSHES